MPPAPDTSDWLGCSITYTPHAVEDTHLPQLVPLLLHSPSPLAMSNQRPRESSKTMRNRRRPEVQSEHDPQAKSSSTLGESTGALQAVNESHSRCSSRAPAHVWDSAEQSIGQEVTYSCRTTNLDHLTITTQEKGQHTKVERVNDAERPVQELEGILCRTDSNNLPTTSSVPTDNIPRTPGIVPPMSARRSISPPSRYLGVVSNEVSFPPVTLSQANLTRCS